MKGFSPAAAHADPEVARADFIAQALENPINRVILERLPRVGLADCWLVAGALFQTVWNLQGGRAPTADIRDYDLFYFDDSDLSWEAEDAAIRRAAALFADLSATVELRNQARVHVWYERRFGHPCPRLASSRHGIERFLVAGTCIGLRPAEDGHVELCAPFGLGDATCGVLRPNPTNPAPQLFRRKAESYRARWPWLTITREPAEMTSTCRRDDAPRRECPERIMRDSSRNCKDAIAAQDVAEGAQWGIVPSSGTG